MRKDKKWLKEKIREISRHVGHEYLYIINIQTVLKPIDQLDEPEVLSQEWIDKHRKSYTMEDSVEISDLQNLIVPKQELPVIPEYVADWVAKHRKNLDLYPALKKLEGNPMTWKRIYEWYRMNAHEFANAYLTGEYIVEEEQRYYAKLKEVHPLEKEWLVNLTPSNYYVISTKGLRLGEFILDLVGIKSKASTYTLEGWGRYGINDSNADFVKVEEEE